MENEKKLDMNGVAKDAAEAEKAAAEANQEAESDCYTHTFKKPFVWRGNEYKTLTFDWSVINGRVHLEIENEMLMKGRTLITPAFTGDFLVGMAARACTEKGIDRQAIMDMPVRDFQAITREARDFLLRAE